MTKERLILLEEYIKLRKFPLLIPGVLSNIFDNSIILKSSISSSELNGHYENVEFCPPNWYKELVSKSSSGPVILVIENLDQISTLEQLKFVEILKYRKISTFDLPENLLIIVTTLKEKNFLINEDVYSLLTQI